MEQMARHNTEATTLAETLTTRKNFKGAKLAGRTGQDPKNRLTKPMASLAGSLTTPSRIVRPDDALLN